MHHPGLTLLGRGWAQYIGGSVPITLLLDSFALCMASTVVRWRTGECFSYTAYSWAALACPPPLSPLSVLSCSVSSVAGVIKRLLRVDSASFFCCQKEVPELVYLNVDKMSLMDCTQHTHMEESLCCVKRGCMQIRGGVGGLPRRPANAS